jgi:hypothetical protein
MSTAPSDDDWQFWGLVLTVFLIVMLPLGDEPNREMALANAAAVGLILIAIALLAFAQHQVWTNIGQLLLGLWLAGSPRLLGYWTPTGIAQWHQALGGFLASLARLSLWLCHIRNRSDH